MTLLPGLADLRGNVRSEPATVVFSTGATFPPYSIRGRVFDLAAQRPAPNAYVEAAVRGDTSFVYVGAADTSGTFDPRSRQRQHVHRSRAHRSERESRARPQRKVGQHDDHRRRRGKPGVHGARRHRARFRSAAHRQHPGARQRARSASRSTGSSIPSMPLQPALITIQRADSTQMEIARVEGATPYERARQVRDSIRLADSLRTARRDTAAAAATPTPPPVLTPGGARPAPAPPKPNKLRSRARDHHHARARPAVYRPEQRIVSRCADSETSWVEHIRLRRALQRRDCARVRSPCRGRHLRAPQPTAHDARRPTRFDAHRRPNERRTTDVAEREHAVGERRRSCVARPHAAIGRRRCDPSYHRSAYEPRRAQRPRRLDAWAEAISVAIGAATRPSLRRVINATGVVLHTNLGRAPLAPAAHRRRRARRFRILESRIRRRRVANADRATCTARRCSASSPAPKTRSSSTTARRRWCSCSTRSPNGTRRGGVARRAGRDRRQLPHSRHHGEERRAAASRSAPRTARTSTTTRTRSRDDTRHHRQSASQQFRARGIRRRSGAGRTGIARGDAVVAVVARPRQRLDGFARRVRIARRADGARRGRAPART